MILRLFMSLQQFFDFACIVCYTAALLFDQIKMIRTSFIVHSS